MGWMFTISEFGFIQRLGIASVRRIVINFNMRILKILRSSCVTVRAKLVSIIQKGNTIGHRRKSHPADNGSCKSLADNCFLPCYHSVHCVSWWVSRPCEGRRDTHQMKREWVFFGVLNPQPSFDICIPAGITLPHSQR